MRVAVEEWGLGEVLPISARTGEGCDVLVERVLSRMPEGEPLYPEDYLTDQTERSIAAECVREKLLALTRQELPHATAVLCERWVERDDVTIWYKRRDEVRQGKLTVGYTGYGGSSHIGPELQFGHVVGDALEEPVLLIKTAWGGKSLHVDFRPPSAAGETGPFYTQMIEEVHEALRSLGDRPYALAGFVWMQGWNDMIDPHSIIIYYAGQIVLS